MAYLVENKIVFGVQPILPLVGFPEGKKRIVMRPDEFVNIYVRTADGIIGYYVAEKDGAWVPHAVMGENRRINEESNKAFEQFSNDLIKKIKNSYLNYSAYMEWAKKQEWYKANDIEK